MLINLINTIEESIQDHETGRLDVRNLKKDGYSWSLYFALGRLIWSNGGQHNHRRFYRKLKQHLPEKLKEGLEVNPDLITEENATVDYGIVSNLLKENQISISQLIKIKNEINIEVLFDIFQLSTIQNQESSEYGQNSGFQWEWFSNVRPQNYIPIPSHLDESSKELVKIAQKEWKQWEEANLTDCLPNQAPVIKDGESIKNAVAAKTYENLKRLLTGNKTLRDIAVEMKRDLLPITKVLWGYHQKGWLSFQDVPDADLSVITGQKKEVKGDHNQNSNATENRKKFLIACVDDSPQVTQTIEMILKENGYDCISINDPLRASATLLKAKPDLIFLDLIMPNTNGYEICTQLRRVSSLQEIPIIILTGKDGLIDRMRAKMVGSTEYLSKPVERNAILEIVYKYLPYPVK